MLFFITVHALGLMLLLEAISSSNLMGFRCVRAVARAEWKLNRNEYQFGVLKAFAVELKRRGAERMLNDEAI